MWCCIACGSTVCDASTLLDRTSSALLQVLLVRDFVTRLSSTQSHSENSEALVKQLIMGAGKTTVILPLLAFFLADGSQLIMQVTLYTF